MGLVASRDQVGGGGGAVVTIGRVTGRTRKFFRIDCPTIERYEVETYATDSTHRLGEGVVMGRKADRISGTYAIRPELTSRNVRV